jgi:stage III sporulation protein AD
MDIIKIAAFALVAAMLSVIIRQYRNDYSMLIGLCAGVMLLGIGVHLIGEIMDSLGLLISSTGIDGSYFEILFKALGITYLVSLASEICQDAGEGAIASKLELAGKAVIMYISLPIFMTVFKMISDLIGY